MMFPEFLALVKPASTMAKPACMKKTSAAPISTHIVLTADNPDISYTFLPFYSAFGLVILFRNLCVDGCFGATRISSGFPSSTTTPPSMNTTLEATSLANAISCVTTIIVIPVCATALIVFNTSPTSSGSSAEVGSSKRITSGSSISALAIPALCC